jgi:hypothetical protein
MRVWHGIVVLGRCVCVTVVVDKQYPCLSESCTANTVESPEGVSQLFSFNLGVTS